MGDFTEITIPEKINNLPPITSIFAGYEYSLFLDENGYVWSCGDNEKGQLGLGDNNNRNQAEQITTLPKIVSVFAGYAFSTFLDCEGSVWGCGNNNYGQLGDSRGTNCRNIAEKIPELPKIISISGGPAHSLFLDCEGAVWCCGYNAFGQLGLGHATNRNKVKDSWPSKNQINWRRCPIFNVCG